MDLDLPSGTLPPAFGPRRLGLDPAAITGIALLGQDHGHAVYRLAVAGRFFVLKWFPDAACAVEVANYALLEAYGVPTPPVRARDRDALLLEDLDTSAVWRLATAADVEAPETGRAVAGWYRALHAAGRRVLAGPGGPPPHLARETDALDPGVLGAVGARLALSDAPGWALALESIGALTTALRALPETLNHADFHWTNLALSRGAQDGAQRAIVFDYHLLGLGPVESDVRNVLSALGEGACAAFLEAYGPLDRRALLLDAPVALLVALREAAGRRVMPRWGKDTLEAVRRGELERCLHRALAAL